MPRPILGALQLEGEVFFLDIPSYRTSGWAEIFGSPNLIRVVKPGNLSAPPLNPAKRNDSTSTVSYQKVSETEWSRSSITFRPAHYAKRSDGGNISGIRLLLDPYRLKFRCPPL